MKGSTSKLLIAMTFIVPTLSAFAQGGSDPIEYRGLCDASAAVAISPDLFIVANDEDNVLRVYRRDQPGMPVQAFDLSAHLGLTDTAATDIRRSSEADLEGAARIGNRIYCLFANPDPGTAIHILSDDGDHRANGDVKCKKREPQRQTFRSIRVKF